MKKLYFAALAVASICLVSCGTKKEETVAPEDAAPVAEEAVVQNETTAELDAAFAALESGDQQAIEAHVAAIADDIEDLIEDGDQAAAEKYVEKLVAWYEANKERVQQYAANSDVVAKIVEATKTMPQSVTEAKKMLEKSGIDVDALEEKYGDQVKAKAAELNEKYGDQIKAKAKEKFDEHADELKEQVKEQAKEKAAEAAKGAVDKLFGGK